MSRSVSVLALVVVCLAAVPRAVAHCDTTRGPVVASARAALAAGDADLVLHWVRPADEAEVRAALRQVIAVRALGPEAAALADAHFFETVVRIHRIGEGACYAGLTDDEPELFVGAADRALASGSSAELERLLVGALRTGLASRFAAARASRDFSIGDVAAGRAFTADYVELLHWIEGVLAATDGGTHDASRTGSEEARRHVSDPGEQPTARVPADSPDSQGGEAAGPGAAPRASGSDRP